MTSQPHIKLYTDSTPNGLKITMALEVLGIPYELEHLDISTMRQKEPWFLEINPNGRIPALVDSFDDGEPIRVFESGSILQYLVDRYDPEHKLSFPRGSREHYQTNNWLFFQHGGIGPMQGQAGHFLKYAPVKIEYGVKRYVTEIRRLYKVLNDHLATSKSGYLVGDHISIADIANLAWVMFGSYTDVNMDAVPHLKEWEARLTARPDIIKGYNTPKPLGIKSANPEEGGEKYRQHNQSWVIKSQQADQERFATA
ncbi:glutathione S-transferase [Trichoderma evansii]